MQVVADSEPLKKDRLSYYAHFVRDGKSGEKLSEKSCKNASLSYISWVCYLMWKWISYLEILASFDMGV